MCVCMDYICSDQTESAYTAALEGQQKRAISIINSMSSAVPIPLLRWAQFTHSHIMCWIVNWVCTNLLNGLFIFALSSLSPSSSHLLPSHLLLFTLNLSFNHLRAVSWVLLWVFGKLYNKVHVPKKHAAMLKKAQEVKDENSTCVLFQYFSLIKQ